MKVDVIKKDGKIIFLEAGNDFADMLANTLKASLGSIASLSDAGGFGTLAKSISELRDPVFLEGNSSNAKKVTSLDISEAFSDAVDCSQMQVHRNSSCTVSNEWKRGGQMGCTFTNSSSSYYYGICFDEVADFELSVTVSQNVNMMLGFFPVPALLAKNLVKEPSKQHSGFFVQPKDGGNVTVYSPQANSGSYSSQSKGTSVFCHNENGNEYELRIRVSTKGSGSGMRIFEVSKTAGTDWTQLAFSQNLPTSDKKISPAVLFCGSGQFLNVTLTPKKPSLLQDPVFHPYCKFLISNSLATCESSSLKAFEILRQCGAKDADSVQVTTVTVTKEILCRLIARAMLGKSDVLEYAFGGAAGSGSRSMSLGRGGA
ncbi:unnamed protein product [Amoebophrya sp. A25]|nr:unnamed protein product [Amoebophrya sp. A25]|eukprot:GSA25T00013610001.1